MVHFMILVLALAGAGCVLLGIWGFHLATARRQVRAEIDAPLPKAERNRTFILHRLTEFIGKPFTDTVLEWLGEARQSGIRRRIEAAGRPEGLTVRRYVRRKVGEVLIYGTGGVVLFLNGSAIIALLVLAFGALTDIDLYLKTQQRQDDIQKQLPDFLDVLAVTVGAGLSFRQAVERVADSMPGTLASEFQLALRQMEIGTSRREAFEALRRRNHNEALSKFVTAIQQAEELGAPLAQALMEISQDMRRQDAQYLRRKAQQVNPRVTAITAATMLPGLILLIGGSLFIGTEVNLGVIFGG